MLAKEVVHKRGVIQYAVGRMGIFSFYISLYVVLLGSYAHKTVFEYSYCTVGYGAEKCENVISLDCAGTVMP